MKSKLESFGKALKTVYNHPIKKGAVLVLIGMAIGRGLTNLEYNDILSKCEVFAWDTFEEDLNVTEFFQLLSPEMRIMENCPTQICIN